VPRLLRCIQIAIPTGAKETARSFYRDVGCDAMPKPASLRDRGGAWFPQGGVEIHLGVDSGFRPAGKSHPGILVADLDELEVKLCATGP